MRAIYAGLSAGYLYPFTADWDDERGLGVTEVSRSEWEPAAELAEWLDQASESWPEGLAPSEPAWAMC